MKPETFQQAQDLLDKKTNLKNFKLAIEQSIHDDVKNLKLIANNKYEKTVCNVEFNSVVLPEEVKTKFLSALDDLAQNIEKEILHIDLEFENLN